MDFSKMSRNPSKVHADLVASGTGLVTKGGCTVMFPVSYTSKSLAFISSEIQVVGVWLITTDFKTYGSANATAMMKMKPDAIDTITVNGVDLYKLTFNPGSVVILNRFLIRDKKIIYNAMSYTYDYGKAPFWWNAVDHAELLSSSRDWNDMTVFKDQITHDIYSAHLQRSQTNAKKFFRSTVKSPNDVVDISPRFIPLRDGALNKTSRLAKLADTELNRGIRNALLDDPIREEPLEQLFMR